MNYLKNTHKVIALITIIMLSSFTISQLIQEEDLIIGEWVSIEDSNWRLNYNNQGKCYDYYQGILETTYFYSITEETANNGVIFSYLKLVNINDSDDVYNYEINALNENNLALDYQGDLNEKLMLFEKQ
jgi:hypothetical protein